MSVIQVVDLVFTVVGGFSTGWLLTHLWDKWRGRHKSPPPTPIEWVETERLIDELLGRSLLVVVVSERRMGGVDIRVQTGDVRVTPAAAAGLLTTAATRVLDGAEEVE